GIKQDYQQAIYWFRKAADQGDDDAYNSIGWMYKCGHGVEQNYSLALEWFHKSAECNNSSGWYNLGCMYRDGHGTAQDLQQALYWFKKAQPTGKWNVDEEIRKLEAQLHA
ncbi:TPA: sel1 repeat family protein, partial [Salmonella enterica]|nr:sel1 repeat family protein [Salmonella enterica]